MKALFVSAHLDDAEGGAAGTAQRLLESGYELHHIGLSMNGRREEATKSLKYLGFKKMLWLDYPIRNLSEYRQDILEYLCAISDAYELVFCPSSFDTHQDHQVAFQETLRAFRWCSSIYGYDFPWNADLDSHLDYFVEISETQLKKKMKALSFYRSQRGKLNAAIQPRYVKALAIERGNHIGIPYAEAFEVIKQAWKVSS